VLRVNSYPQPGRAWKPTPWTLVAPGGRRYRGAPPRGVDVKQPLVGGPRGPGRPGGGSQGPGGGTPGTPVPRSRIRDPDPWPGRPQGAPGDPGNGVPGPRRPRRGGFYINPSRRGPAVPGPPGAGRPGSRGPGEPSGASGPDLLRVLPGAPALFPDPPPGREPRGPGARG